jgi:hypothetical protein
MDDGLEAVSKKSSVRIGGSAVHTPTTDAAAAAASKLPPPKEHPLERPRYSKHCEVLSIMNTASRLAVVMSGSVSWVMWWHVLM